MPIIGMLCALHICDANGLSSILGTMAVNPYSLFIYVPTIYIPLYVVAYICLYFRYRCPFCKKAWSFALQTPNPDSAKRAYQCIACGHRDF